MNPQSTGFSEPEADLDVAEADAIMRDYREWAAAGRPGAVSHDEVMAVLLGGRAH
jgi:hypothetical protein